MRKAALLLLLFTACAGSRVGNFDYADPKCPKNDATSELTVRYLGSGGVYINWKGDGLLIGPYFSHNGGFLLALTAHVHFDDARIAEGMRDVKNVRAILFGHSHFDHIGDLPRIARDYVTSGPVYTNDSGVKLLGGYRELQARAESVEGREQIDVPGSAIRIRPIKWDHAPQLCRWRHLPCTYAMGEAQPQHEEWHRVHLRSLRGGRTYAYVIELMKGNEVAFRIFYNDAAGDERLVELPPAGTYNLAILCMPSYDFVHGYPETLLRRLQPQHVLISHYEDFFKKQKTRSWNFVPLLGDSKAKRFIGRIEAGVTDPHAPAQEFCGARTTRWSMPVPGETLVFQ